MSFPRDSGSIHQLALWLGTRIALVAAGGISPVQVDLLLVGQQVPPVFEGLFTPWAELILNLHVHNLHVPLPLGEVMSGPEFPDL